MKLKSSIAPLLAAFGFFVTLTVWGFASPPGSAPDDDFHLPSIWCANGFVEGLCDPEFEGDGFGQTPEPLAPVAICFAFKSDVSAACQAQMFDWNDKTLRGSRTNENGRFPNGFYRTMHSLIGENTLLSAMGMRVFNSALAVIVFFLSFLVVRNNLKTPVVMAWLRSTIPLALFTIPSTNPSSWTIIGLGSYWAVLIDFLQETDRRRKIFAGLLLVFTAWIALTSRSEAGPYLIVITATILIFLQSWKNIFNSWKPLILPALIMLLSFYEFITTPSTLGISTGLPGGDENRSSAEVWMTNIMRLPVLYTGSLGSWNLGWMDTPIPDITFFFAMFVFAGLIFTGIGQMSKYKLLALLFLLSMMAFIPLRILALGKNVVGENVQPRYFLPFLFVIIGLSLFINYKESFITFSNSQLIFIATSLSIAHAFALHYVMRRYITGTDVVSWNLNRNAEWWWDPLPSPMTTWFIGSFAYILMISIAITYLSNLAKKSQLLQH